MSNTIKDMMAFLESIEKGHLKNNVIEVAKKHGFETIVPLVLEYDTTGELRNREGGGASTLDQFSSMASSKVSMGGGFVVVYGAAPDEDGRMPHDKTKFIKVSMKGVTTFDGTINDAYNDKLDAE